MIVDRLEDVGAAVALLREEANAAAAEHRTGMDRREVHVDVAPEGQGGGGGVGPPRPLGPEGQSVDGGVGLPRPIVALGFDTETQ